MGLSKNRQLSNLLDKDSGLVKGSLSDSDQIVSSGNKGIESTSASTTVYATLANLPGSATTGDQAFVSSNNGLYIYNGSGWYKVALVNATPYWDSEASASYTFTVDTAITISLLAGDSDGHSITYTATPDSDANLFITITKDSDNGRVFTLTPDSENEAPGNSNSGTVTFKASDGVSFASTVSTFTLIFSNIIDNSAETVVLMKAAGNSATNAAITYQNSSDISTGFTEVGAPQASTFSPYRSGGYSTKFADSVAGNLNWSGTYLDSDYTIEAWIYTTEVDNSGYNNIISDQSSNVQLTLHNTSTGNITTVYGGAVKLGPTSTGTGLDEWAHFVWEREGTTIRHYANGALVGSGTADSNAFTISKIGQYYTGGWEHHGYIRDLRVLKTAKYGGSSYTIPTSSPALSDDATTQFIACHLPYIKAEGVSISRTGSTYTSTAPYGPYDYEPWTADSVGGSVYFDDSSRMNATIAAIGTSDFTIEGWIYPLQVSTNETLICCADGTTGGSTNWQFNINNSSQLTFKYNGATEINSTATLPLNQWHHAAVTATGGTIYMWVNGVQDGSVSYSHNYTDTRVKLGTNRSQASYLNGYVADVRVIIGTAQYTSNFTPPTAPLSHTGSGTSLLMNNKSDANVYDAAAANSLLLSGNTTTNTSTRKFTTSSAVYFDGTGDYISIPSDDRFEFGSRPFTVEMWVYIVSTSDSYGRLIECGAYDTSGTWRINYNNTASSLMFQIGHPTSRPEITTSTALSLNTWYHIAVTRSGNTIKMFVNGTQEGGDLSYSGSLVGPDFNNLLLGVGVSSASSSTPLNYHNGYLQDVRITKGLARYTTNFTPPTAEFEL